MLEFLKSLPSQLWTGILRVLELVTASVLSYRAGKNAGRVERAEADAELEGKYADIAVGDDDTIDRLQSGKF